MEAGDRLRPRDVPGRVLRRPLHGYARRKGGARDRRSDLHGHRQRALSGEARNGRARRDILTPPARGSHTRLARRVRSASSVFGHREGVEGLRAEVAQILSRSSRPSCPPRRHHHIVDHRLFEVAAPQRKAHDRRQGALRPSCLPRMVRRKALPLRQRHARLRAHAAGVDRESVIASRCREAEAGDRQAVPPRGGEGDRGVAGAERSEGSPTRGGRTGDRCAHPGLPEGRAELRAHRRAAKR